MFIGTITAVGGGVIRDILSNETPLVLRREFYATAAIIGSLIYFAVRSVFNEASALEFSFLITLTLRILAIRFNWELPRREINSS